MSATLATNGGSSTGRIVVLIITYIVCGLIGLGIAGIAVLFADPCGLFYTSSSDSHYTDATDAIMGLGGIAYLLASIPLAMLRERRIVWLISPLAAALVTVGAVALIVMAADDPANTCDITRGW